MKICSDFSAINVLQVGGCMVRPCLVLKGTAKLFSNMSDQKATCLINTALKNVVMP